MEFAFCNYRVFLRQNLNMHKKFLVWQKRFSYKIFLLDIRSYWHQNIAAWCWIIKDFLFRDNLTWSLLIETNASATWPIPWGKNTVIVCLRILKYDVRTNTWQDQPKRKKTMKRKIKLRIHIKSISIRQIYFLDRFRVNRILRWFLI